MIRTTKGQTALELEETPLGSGGEGDVYRIKAPGQHSGDVAKILKPDKTDPSRPETKDRLRKLEYLIANPPALVNSHSVIWPSDTISLNGRFAGYIMPTAVKGQKLTILTLPEVKKRYQQDWGRFDHRKKGSEDLRVKLCFNIAAALSQIHAAKRYVLVDLKPDNILVEPSSGQISIIDIDSVEVYEGTKVLFRAPVSTPEYSPPEIATLDTVSGFIPESWDRFSFGVIFYQVLFGIHPFAGTCKAPWDKCTEISQMIEQGLFVHGANKSKFASIPPLHNKFYEYPQDIRQLFLDCFELGHRNPTLRPDINAWCKVLERYLTTVPLTPSAVPGPVQATGVRYARTQVVQTQRPVVAPSRSGSRRPLPGSRTPTNLPGTPPPNIPRPTRQQTSSIGNSSSFRQTFNRGSQAYANSSQSLKNRLAQRRVVRKRYLVVLGKRYELTPIINGALYSLAAAVVAVFFMGLYLKSASNRTANRNTKVEASMELGAVYVRDLKTGVVTPMHPEDVTRIAADAESAGSEAETDANIYDYGMYRAEKYGAIEKEIDNVLNEYILNQLRNTENFVGNLNCHLVFTLEKTRRVRLQFSRLEGTIPVSNDLREKLVRVNFEPVVEGGSPKISKAEFTYDKQVNSNVRKLTIRNTEQGIQLPKGGNDSMLKTKIASFLADRNMGLGEYDITYQELSINADVRIVAVQDAVKSEVNKKAKQ